MVRGIDVDVEKEETSCTTCGYIFDSFQDAIRHFEEECKKPVEQD